MNQQLVFDYLDELTQIRKLQPPTSTPVTHVLLQLHLDRNPRYRPLLVRHMPENWAEFEGYVQAWIAARNAEDAAIMGVSK